MTKGPLSREVNVALAFVHSDNDLGYLTESVVVEQGMLYKTSANV